MDLENPEISHVSDTALMVAAARALETARPDGLIQDPFAERLAGVRGMAILRGLERSAILTFGVGIRSRFMDELLLGVLAEGEIDTVLILGAGLDTRPWRLGLSSKLTWIEVDFPDVLEYKYARLTDPPHCRMERLAVDLNDKAARDAVLSKAGESTVLITEGLLMYLSSEAVEGISLGAERAGVRRWLMDLTSADFARNVGTNPSVENVRAPTALSGTQIRDVLQHHGWSSLKFRSYARDVMTAAPGRVAALMQARAGAGGMPPVPPPADDPSGVHLFAR